jgi:PKD repeat protein
MPLGWQRFQREERRCLGVRNIKIVAMLRIGRMHMKSMESTKWKSSCLHFGWVLWMLGCMICGNLTAQVTYNFGSSNGGANVTATDDKGFLLHYQVPNGRLAYQKYDSNAVFQYGFTQPANQIYTSTQRFGKVFCLLNSTHSDTIRLQKINMATGAVEINRRIGGPQYGTIGYFAYSPYHFVATQDSGLLVVLSKWQTYNAFFTDVSMVKFDKNLNVQFVRAGGWPTTQNILSRLVKQHSDGSIWHITSVGLVPGFGLNILRIDPQTGATLNQITVNNIGNPTTGGFAEVPGRVILSGITANEGYALSIAPDLSAVHWVKRYAVPLNFAGAYEFNTGPNNNLYGHLGDLVMCIRPADGSVVWSVNADAAANVVPRIRLGLYKMLALYSPGGTELKGALIDSLGVGLCNPVNYPVTVTTLTNTTTSFNLNLYATGGLTHFTLPNPTSTPVTASPTVACTAICNFTAGFTASANSLIASFAPLPFGLSSYYWTFGDGGTSNSMAPVHSYAASGTYTVCLIGTSGCMSDTVCQQVTVTCTSPTASFTTSGTSQTINFSNASTGSGPLTYAWAFGNGQTSTQTSPTHVYSSPGYYNACLIVNGPCGSDTTCTLVNAGCVTTVASFSATSNLLAAQFNNSSTSAGATTHSWDFGDGQMSTQASPSHVLCCFGDLYGMLDCQFAMWRRYYLPTGHYHMSRPDRSIYVQFQSLYREFQQWQHRSYKHLLGLWRRANEQSNQSLAYVRGHRKLHRLLDLKFHLRCRYKLCADHGHLSPTGFGIFCQYQSDDRELHEPQLWSHKFLLGLWRRPIKYRPEPDTCLHHARYVHSLSDRQFAMWRRYHVLAGHRRLSDIVCCDG